MVSIEEKRVYDARLEETAVYVATDLGVAVVDVSDDLVGEFGLAHRCTARDVAAVDGLLAVATDEDVLLHEPAADGEDADGGGDFEPLGFGPATAVGFDGDSLLAVDPDGRIARGDGEGWTDLGTPGDSGDVRAIDGDLVAAADGVYRAAGDDLEPVGLADVRDVSAAGTPLAATDDGLYRLGNGWLDAASGAFRVVAADRRTPAGSLDRAHAATGDALYAHDDGDWTPVDLPASGEIAAVTYAEGTYAATEDGTFLLSAGDGWRDQHLGLPGVRALAAP